jgi:hypothetical protein
MQNLHLLEYSAEAFWCHVHYYQCMAVLVKLAVMGYVFQFIVVGITEMLTSQALMTLYHVMQLQ